jgi:hypothetical protein
VALSAKDVLMACQRAAGLSSPVFLTFLEIGSKLVSVLRLVNIIRLKAT